MALVHRRHGRMIEGAGALPFAALLRAPSARAGRIVVAVVSGGNIAVERFHALIAPPPRGRGGRGGSAAS
jgi:threonine dehydratase